MRKISSNKKILLVVLSIFLAFLIAESGLRIAEFSSRHFYLPDYDYASIKQGEKVIFCLGDSFTYGVGVDFKDSYPLQLERILKNNFGYTQARVFNLGVPGYDSSQILKRFKTQLNKVKPDIVIATVGANDYWKFDIDKKEDMTDLSASFKKILFKTRMFRLLSVFWANIRNIKQGEVEIRGHCKIEKNPDSAALVAGDLDKANSLRQAGRFEKARMVYVDILKKYPDYKTALFELGRNYKLSGKFKKALNLFLALFAKYPSDTDVFNEIKDTLIRENDSRKTAAVYLMLHKRFPHSKIISQALSAAYITLGGEYFLQDELEKTEDLYYMAMALDSQKCYTHGDVLKEIKIYKKIYNNLYGLAQLCDKKKINLIVCGYPSFLPRAVKHVAARRQLTLIDHAPVFKAAIEKYPEKQYFISKNDPHCTKEGYRLMAENVAEKVVEFLRQKN